MDLKNPKTKAAIFLKNFILDLAGCMLMATAVKVFSSPNEIAPGGAVGIATMLNYLFKLPIGTVTLAINIPLLLIAYKKLGKIFVFKTLQVLLINLVAVDFLLASPPAYMGDPMLAAIFGGVLNGVGMGIIFSHGATSGGSDIVNKLIQKKYPYISTGQLIVGINAVVILTAAFVYGNIEASLYGLVMTFAGSKVTDALLYGADTGKSCTIVTSKPDEIAKVITENLHRSATLWQGKGAYRGDSKWVLICVVRKQEFYILKQLIKEVDTEAFIIVSEAHQIIGKGFKPIDSADN